MIIVRLKRLKKPYLLALRFRLESRFEKMSRVTDRLETIVAYFSMLSNDQGTQFDLNIFALISYFYVLKIK